MKKKCNILLLWDRMGDYHRARVKALELALGKEHVFSADLGGGDGLYKWTTTESQTNYFRLSEKNVDKVDALEALSEFRRVVKENNITHVCIPGYGRLAYILMLLWCKVTGIKVLMFAESWYAGNVLVEKIKGYFLNYTVDVVFASGKRAAKHFRTRINISSDKIIEGYSVVDNEHFSSAISIASTKPTLLCVARFANEKNIEMLINAFNKSSIKTQWHLKIVGGGPLKSKLQELISNGDTIELQEWLSYSELPALYASSSCFILPSNFEPWGLVVNEAMAASLPLLLSEEIGALPDLLVEGGNGWSFSLTEAEFVNALNNLSGKTAEQLLEMGNVSKTIIQRYSCTTWAQAISKWINNSIV